MTVRVQQHQIRQRVVSPINPFLQVMDVPVAFILQLLVAGHKLAFLSKLKPSTLAREVILVAALIVIAVTDANEFRAVLLD